MPGATCPNCGKAFDGEMPKFCTKCGTSIDATPDDVQPVLQKAIEALRVCDVRSATTHLERAARMSPSCSDVWYLYALANIRDVQKYEMYIGMAENRENTSLGLFGKGDVHRFEEGWDNESGRMISKAKEMLALGNRNAAAGYINRASFMSPECADVWFLKATVAGDPKWRMMYVRAGEGKPVSKGIFGRDEFLEYQTKTLSTVTFRWEGANQKLHLDIIIPESRPITLNAENGYSATAELPNGALKGKAVMVGEDGFAVGTVLNFTLRISPGAEFILINQGFFKSRLAFRDTEL